MSVSLSQFDSMISVINARNPAFKFPRLVFFREHRHARKRCRPFSNILGDLFGCFD